MEGGERDGNCLKGEEGDIRSRFGGGRGNICVEPNQYEKRHREKVQVTNSEISRLPSVGLLS